jgi:LmbE family N-acetylglucosaminyl deacetylase
MLPIATLQSQPTQIMNSSQIKLALQKLNVVGSVLYIAAHPDDENTALLSYLTTEKHLRTGYLAMTRGDGGQNLIGDEQGELLGIIRTQELLQARRIDGAEQFFSRAIDFGYTKSPEETFKFWDKQKILSDVVYVIRKFRPDVIITRFPTTGEGGHGHHTASAILALEAFKISGDPNVFPEQLKYVKPWKVKRVFWNAWTPALNSMGINADTLASINLGKYNQLLGKSYMEIAALSRSMHKSQGFGASARRGDYVNYFYSLDKSNYPGKVFDGIDLSWKRINGSDQISALLSKAEKDFDPENPSSIVPDLVRAYKLIQNINDEYWKEIKSKEIKAVIKSCLGLWVEAVTEQKTVVPGDTLRINTDVVNRSGTDVNLDKISFPFTVSTNLQTDLKNNNLVENSAVVTVPTGCDYTQPYWLAKNHGYGTYEVSDPKLLGLAEAPPQITVEFSFEISGEVFSYSTPVFYNYTDPVDGEIYQPVEVVPPVTIQFEQPLFLFKDFDQKKIAVTITAQQDIPKGSLIVKAENDWIVKPASFEFSYMKKGEVQSFTVNLNPSGSSTISNLKADVVLNGKDYNNSMIKIDYKHIPEQVYLPEANAKLVYVDIGKTRVVNIGYLPGSGDKIPNILLQLGYNVTLLDDHSVMNGNLSQFDVVIVGIRAFNTVDKIPVYNEKLNQYVNDGGTLVEQYNTTGDLIMEPGVYPLTISRDRVTEEDSPVKILDENNSLMNYPNKITLKDFDGWIQERGLYFPNQWDERYQPLLEMNDANQTPVKGSLLYTTYGKGSFIYTGLSFFRELPAGVPGAIRLFVNLVSAGNHGS